ncbi:aspartate/glutamate racemase family protein [Candidatus Peregrinibacteria bacterium]|nr:aspartate/glutamate racemase family protein [Candidatus Peregrinibacteria bacterium]
MKKIGLIGGVGWPSTIDYYRIINQEANKKFGNLCSPEILIYSLNFEPLMRLQYQGKWEESAQVLIQAAQSLEKAGADCVLICSVTTNIPSKRVQEKISIPLLSIITPCARIIQKMGLKTVGLLGTKATMGHSFFRDGLSKFGISVITPDESERNVIHKVIYNELCKNEIKSESREKYLKIINALVSVGAEGVILGCTEIPLLISSADVNIPSFDITHLHALEAFNFAIE